VSGPRRLEERSNAGVQRGQTRSRALTLVNELVTYSHGHVKWAGSSVPKTPKRGKDLPSDVLALRWSINRHLAV